MFDEKSQAQSAYYYWFQQVNQHQELLDKAKEELKLARLSLDRLGIPINKNEPELPLGKPNVRSDKVHQSRTR